MFCCVVENERLSWELEQVRGLVDMQELAVLGTDLHSLRNQILLMAQREDNAQVGHTPPLHFALWGQAGGKGRARETYLIKKACSICV